MAKKTGALAKDPKPSGNADLRRYNRALAGLNKDPQSAKWQNQAAKYFQKLTPQQQLGSMSTQAGNFYNPMMANYMQFDPNKPFQGYEQGFGQEMDKAREAVMNQFEARLQPQFEQEDAAFQQRMAEQGIDPNSGAYQAQYRAMKQGQADARQQAMTNAFTLGSQYQQQGFEQGLKSYMVPATVWQTAGRDPFVAQQEALQNEAQRRAQLEATRMSTGATIASSRIGAEASKDIAGMEYASRYNQPRPNPWAQGIGSFVNTVAPYVANRGR